MIEAKKLRKIYKTKGGVRVKALDGVSLKLPKTGMVFLLGKSGSGKSTLLNVLGGLDSYDSGEIIIKGTSSKSFKQSHFDSYRNTYIGFIFQEYNLLEELTVGANIALAIELQGRKATNEEIDSILREVDLEGYGARKPNELSGGQKQRVAIARALVKKPEIIMADEPTGALDSATGKQVFDTLKRLSSDKLVLIVSHDREFSEQYADRIIELKDGVIISDVEKVCDESKPETETPDSPPLVFDGDEISVAAGYSLTEDDRIAINEYLAKIGTGAILKQKNFDKGRGSSSDFKETDESRIEYPKGEVFKLIKSKLSLANAFLLGSGALKHKKIRLFFTVMLSVVAFTLFGLADTVAAYDSVKTATNSIFDTGVPYASYVKSIKLGTDSWAYWSTDNTLLTPEDIEKIKTETGRDVIGVYRNEAELSFFGNLGYKTVEGTRPSAIFSNSFSGLAGVTDELLEEHGFTLTGRLPEEGKNEIAVTKYTYEYFTKVGYKNYSSDGSVEVDIKSETDLIGKSLNLDIEYNKTNAFTVVGIIDTGFDYSRYEKLADENAEFTMNLIEMMALTAELSAAQSSSFACIGFVHPALISDMIDKNANKPAKITDGYLQLYTVYDDSMVVDGDWYNIWGDEFDNVISEKMFESLNSLEKAGDGIVWFDAPLSSLNDNQIIMTLSMFEEFIIGNSAYTPDSFYNPEYLFGIERIMYDNAQNWEINYVSLKSIFEDPVYYTAVKFAHENPEGARAVFRAAGWSEEKIERDLSGTCIYSEFANLANWYASPERTEFDKVINDAAVKAYLDDMILRYDLEAFKTPDVLKELLIAKYTHAGKEYCSTDPNDILFKFNLAGMLDNIIAKKFAAENFEDAKAFFLTAVSNTDESVLDSVSASDILVTYSKYLLSSSENPPAGFTPKVPIDFKIAKTELLNRCYKSAPTDSKLVLAADCLISGEYRSVKDVEIVGIAPEYISSRGEAKNYIVLSEGLIDSLLGPNRGGIYDYAVGAMPEDKASINEIVKFSKNYTNEEGNAKYHLTNNVTLELDLVDEILNILGKVFLYVGIGFAVFAALMLTNFIGTSITYKKQDIGILRAIGSRSGDVFRIFFAESFIIAMANCLLANIFTLTLTLAINSALRQSAGLLITFLSYGIRQIGVLLLVSLGVAFIATFVPVWKIASMKPIDAIKNRK